MTFFLTALHENDYLKLLHSPCGPGTGMHMNDIEWYLWLPTLASPVPSACLLFIIIIIAFYIRHKRQNSRQCCCSLLDYFVGLQVMKIVQDHVSTALIAEMLQYPRFDPRSIDHSCVLCVCFFCCFLVYSQAA